MTQFNFKRDISADCNRDSHHDQHPKLEVELDFKRCDGGAQQRRYHQHEKSVEHFPANRIHPLFRHRLGVCAIVAASSGKTILWTATMRLSVARSICLNCSIISPLGGSQKKMNPPD